VTAEPDEIVAALQVVLPTAETSVVAEVIVAGERLGEFAVVTAINSRMRHNRTIMRATRRPLGARRRRNKPTLIGPVCRHRSVRAEGTGRNTGSSRVRF